MIELGTPEKPIYSKVLQYDKAATKHYMIVCDEGWRQSIVCCDMYDWAADWLVNMIQNQPYAPNTRTPFASNYKP